MFQNAQALKPAAPKKAGKEKPTLEVKDVEKLAMIRALKDALEAVGGTFDKEIKATVFKHYAELAKKTGQRPESVRAIDGKATASVSLSKRATTSPLNEQQVELLRAHGLEPKSEVVTPKLFAVNPAYEKDVALLDKVTKALEKIVPADFIVVQEEKSKFVVTDELLTQVFTGMADAEEPIPAEILELCTSLSTKPQLEETNIPAILDFVRGLLTTPATDTFATVTPAPEVVKIEKPKKAKKAA